MISRIFRTGCACLTGVLLFSTGTAGAATLAYDPFLTGTSSTTYTATGGYPGPASPPPATPTDALVWSDSTSSSPVTRIGQNPTTQGFTGAWRMSGTESSNVYARLQSTQALSYSAQSGTQILATAGGQVRLARSSSGSGVKSFSRTVDVGNSTTYTSGIYMSGLIQFTSTVDASAIRLTSTDGSTATTFSMDIAAGGGLSIAGGSTVSAVTTGAISTGTTYFFVWKLEDATTTGDGDRFSLYLNPVDLSSESLNTATLSVGSTASNFFVTGDAAYSLGQFTFQSDISNGRAFLVDEIRIGNSWADVTTFTTVPEPNRALLVLMGLGMAILRRRAR